MTTFHTVVEIISLVAKSFHLMDSGVRICQLCQKPGPLNENERTELITEVVFGIFQTADIGLGGYRLTSSNSKNAHIFKSLQLATATCAGLSHTAKTIIPMTRSEQITPDQWVDLLGVILFRIGDASQVAISDPKYRAKLHKSFEITNDSSELGGCAVLIISKRDSIKQAAFVIAKWCKRLFNKKRQEEVAAGAAGVAAQAGVRGNVQPRQAQRPVMIAPDHAQNEEDLHNYLNGVFEAVIDWRALQTIPVELQHDLILQQYICRITGGCIRFIVRPRGVFDVYYEKSAIENWLQERAAESPPGWHENVTFNRNNIEEDRFLQRPIDERLRQIAEEWQNIARENHVN